jgi:hypothetical protein
MIGAANLPGCFSDFEVPILDVYMQVFVQVKDGKGSFYRTPRPCEIAGLGGADFLLHLDHCSRTGTSTVIAKERIC